MSATVSTDKAQRVGDGHDGNGCPMLTRGGIAAVYHLLRHERAHTIVYAHKPVGVSRYGKKSVARRREAGVAPGCDSVLHIERMVTAEAVPIVVLALGKHKDDARPRHCSGKTAYGVHKHRHAAEREKLFGHVAAHAQTLSACHYYDVIHRFSFFTAKMLKPIICLTAGQSMPCRQA